MDGIGKLWTVLEQFYDKQKIDPMSPE